MQWYRNQDLVPTGFYVAPRKLDVRAVVRGEDGAHAPDAARLKGVEGGEYFRLPMVLGVMLSPVIGGAFAMGMAPLVLLWLGREILRRITAKRVFTAGEPALRGIYFGLNTLGARHVSAHAAAIDAAPGTRWWRAPAPLLVLLSPVVGGLFVLLFPLILAVAVAYAAVRALIHPLVVLVRRRVTLADARWEPSAAYAAHARARAERGEEPALVDDQVLDPSELKPVAKPRDAGEGEG